MNRRSPLIYGLLLAIWVLVLGWQTVEHFRVDRAARSALIERAKDISTTLGIVLRSQRRFGIISKERLEATLSDLVKPGDLNGIALLNASGAVVVSAGTLTDVETNAVAGPVERWNAQGMIVMNLVDLGTSMTRDIDESNPPIVLSRDDLFRSSETNRLSLRRFPSPNRSELNTNITISLTNNISELDLSLTNRLWLLRRNPERSRFTRLPWMSEEEFKAALQKQGVHSFVLAMSTQAVQATGQHDWRLRCIIALLATAAATGAGFAWRNLTQSADLQLRLVRASELNAHLKEMNLAAAGLAHETRNPLNIIRGLAQMISRQPAAAPEIREQSRAIVDETDKVTVQLNEFINYSRPREVRPTALDLPAVVHEVSQTLRYDLEEKKITLEISGTALGITADEQLLRQAVFNLLLNAIQALPAGGAIQVVVGRQETEGYLEIRDNGSGVPVERRQEIFKPYFTMQEKGTGLGLAVVQQIVLAHGWSIICLPNQPHGAIFRIEHLKLTTTK